MRLMRCLALALVIAVAASGPAGAVERILRFVSDVEVERNGDLLVTESIRVQVDQIQIRHGIFRDFPTAYKRPDGSPVVVGFSVQSVTRDGLDERWTTQGIANGMRVIIGREEILLASGLHEYVIRYRTTRQIGFFRTPTNSTGMRRATAGRSRSNPPRCASRCRKPCRSAKPRFIPARKGRAGKMRRSSNGATATSYSAPPSRCPRTMG